MANVTAMTDDQWAKAASMYQAGYGLDECREYFGVGRPRMRRNLERLGVEIKQQKKIAEPFQMPEDGLLECTICGEKKDIYTEYYWKDGIKPRRGCKECCKLQRKKNEKPPKKDRSGVRTWMRLNGYTVEILANKLSVHRVTFEMYLDGRKSSQNPEITSRLNEMGCKSTNRRPRESGSQSPEVIVSSRKQQVWNPWADGDVQCPVDVSANSILMCPLG